MPSENKERMKKFYSESFGWEMMQLGPEMGGYTVVTTTEVDAKGQPKNPGAINGGFYDKKPDMPDQYPSIVVRSSDLDRDIEKVKNAGGKILGEPWDIPGTGRYVSFLDTEGNRCSLLQPKQM